MLINLSLRTIATCVIIVAVLAILGWSKFAALKRFWSFVYSLISARVIERFKGRRVEGDKSIIDVESDVAHNGISMDEVVNVQTSQGKKVKSASYAPNSRRAIGCSVFISLIKRYGGDEQFAKCKSGPKDSDIVYDCYFESGNHRIGVDFLGIESMSFPNSYHRTHEEFVAQKEASSTKASQSAKLGVFYIQVPFDHSNNEDKISDSIHNALLQYSTIVTRR